jgi:phage shock protein A
MSNLNETVALIRTLQDKIALHEEELRKLKETLERLKKRRRKLERRFSRKIAA